MRAWQRLRGIYGTSCVRMRGGALALIQARASAMHPWLFNKADGPGA